MKKQQAWMGVMLGILLMGIGLPGCSQQEGPVEKAGKEIDQATGKTAATIEQAADEAKTEAENILDQAKETAQEAIDTTKKE